MNEIIKNKKLYIFDMDGTIYLGDQVFECAVKLISWLRNNGRRVMFFTNNASHTPDFYIAKLNRLGFGATRGEIMTSGDVTIEFLRIHRENKSVYLVGTPELESQFLESGIKLTNNDDIQPDIVITSFDTTLTYEKLERACRYIRNGAEYLSTHPDLNCPTEHGSVPDSGALIAFVTASTGAVPVVFGKPNEMVVRMIGEVTGVDRADMCVFGDRLYTDVALGKKNGVTSVLVLSGETSADDVLRADERDRPDFIYDDLGGVLDG